MHCSSAVHAVDLLLSAGQKFVCHRNRSLEYVAAAAVELEEPPVDLHAAVESLVVQARHLTACLEASEQGAGTDVRRVDSGPAWVDSA